jgi:hypothetical protein
MSDNPDCNEDCRRRAECAVCRLTKKPRGRSAPLAMANGLCDSDCPGYYENPQPPHLWPNELIGDEKEPTDDEEPEATETRAREREVCRG